jgi:hypothetical protein
MNSARCVALSLYCFVIGCFAIALLFQGCSGVTYSAINDPAQDIKARGFRYYDTSPYLLITRVKKGKDSKDDEFTSQLLYLPDQTKKFQAHPYCFLASNNNTFTFGSGQQVGVLTDTSVESDSTAVPAAIIAAAEKIVEAGIKTKTLFAQNLAPRELINHDVVLCKIVKFGDAKNRQWGLQVAYADNDSDGSPGNN